MADKPKTEGRKATTSGNKKAPAGKMTAVKSSPAKNRRSARGC